MKNRQIPEPKLIPHVFNQGKEPEFLSRGTVDGGGMVQGWGPMSTAIEFCPF